MNLNILLLLLFEEIVKRKTSQVLEKKTTNKRGFINSLFFDFPD